MKKLLLVLFITGSAFATSAQSMVYKPINPAFGGDSYNYTWLFTSAQAQDKTKDPNAVTPASRERDALQNFQSTLNSQLLNTLAKTLYTSQFGEDGLKEGIYQFGDLTVDVAPGTEGLIIRITDGKGGETSVTVPYY